MSALSRQPTEGTGPKSLDAAVLRISDEHGDAVGLGFLVSDELALTCAHVVSAALGAPDDVEPDASVRLHVDLPLLSSSAEGVTAGVVHWVPPQRSGAGDVAVLRLDAPLPGARPVRLVEAQDVWEHPVRAFGFPAGRPGGVWHAGVLRARQADGWVQADLTGEGYQVSRGFSGTPVWDEKLVGVVGMVAVAESGSPPVSYLIPTGGLLTAWPEMRGLALPPSPFRSLTAFEESDAQVFHGRRAESDELAAALAAGRWVSLVGPSGSGKSSLALAGVVPRLRAAGASAVVLRPASGSSPLSALAAALLPLLESELSETQRLARIPELTGLLRRQGPADAVARLLQVQGGRRLLVVVDQFEELLGLDPATVDELADVLFADALPPTVRVLATLRADFLETALSHPRLGPVVGRHLYALGPLSPERLREVVTAPVDAVPGVRYEPHLADRILADTGTGSGALPLLGFTLDLLWQRQEGGLLTHRAYEELGGVTGALSAHADRVWAEYVPREDEEAARRLFTRLVRMPTGSAAATRRMALRTELGEDQWRIAQRLAATRLLVTGRSVEGAETVELTHEALISGWDKLAAWAAEDRSFLVWRESLRHDRERWEQAGRDPELLPTAVALAGARQWLRERGEDLSDAERAYLEAGRTHRRSRARRRRAFLSGLGIVVVLALLLGTLFVVTQRESEERAALAASRALAGASQDEASADPARSVMLALAAYRASPTQEARNQLLRQYLEHSDTERVLTGALGTFKTLAASSDGNVVLASSQLGRATLFVHAADGRVRSEQVGSAGHVRYPLVSADGTRAGYVQEDGRAAWFDVRADAGRPVGRLRELPAVPGSTTGANEDVKASMSPDGRIIASKVKDRLVWWNLDSGAVGGEVPAPEGMIFDLWVGAGNRTLLTPVYENLNGLSKQEKIGLLAVDMATGRQRVVVSGTEEVLLSGDRKAVVACREQDGQSVLSLHRVSDGALQGGPYREKEERYRTDLCSADAVDATGRFVVLGLGHLRLLDLARNTVVSRSADPVEPVRFLPYETLVSTGGQLLHLQYDDNAITYTEVPRSGDHVLDVGQQTLTDDGSRTITVLADGSRIQLRPSDAHDERVLAEARRSRPHWKPERDDLLQTNGDGTLVADREGRNAVSVREVATLRERTRITAAEPPRLGAGPPIRGGGGGVPYRPAPQWDFRYFFDHSGRLVTVSGTVVQQWDTRTGRQLARFDAGALLRRIAGKEEPDALIGGYPAPDRVTVTVQGDPVVRVVDVTTGRVAAEVRTTEDVRAVQFESTGRYFAVMRRGAVVELWRRYPTPRKVLGPLRSVGEDSATPWVAGFLADGRYLIAADSYVRIYRVDGRAATDSYEFGGRRSAGMEPHAFLDVSKDGRTVIQSSAGGMGGPLTLDATAWQRALCEVIGHRAFTEDEVSSLPVEIPERTVCPAP
ncbi:trypsin-like peptidase domain-containing protein [Streptomyces sp. NPDC049597]|uniref:nSTAND1 domain-containing NTPase n=1 Tax=Streptomyces sp. NPDC049597 TaxID=3155276 RepID=UPI003430DE34